MKFELGEALKDKISGFTGVVLARTEYFTGCIHYGLCPRGLQENGKTKDWDWFDETRLIKAEGATKITKEPREVEGVTSGPEPNAPQN